MVVRILILPYSLIKDEKDSIICFYRDGSLVSFRLWRKEQGYFCFSNRRHHPSALCREPYFSGYPEYTVATLRNPWDTLRTLHTYILVPAAEPLPAHLPQGTVVRTPLSKAVVYSSVHCGLVNNLGAFNSIGGICDLKYIKLPVVQEGVKRGTIADCGDGMNPDMEKIIDLHPDAILLSPFENSGGYGRIEKLNIPIIECADYMETSALGRAEWMRFYGLLFGAAPKADSLFAEVDSCYKRLQHCAMLSSVSLSVVSELKSGSAWYVPGGRSTMGRLFNDACGRYVLRKTNIAVPFP